MTVYYVDLQNGSDAADGLSFANRKKTLSSVVASAGDEIRIMQSPDPFRIGTSLSGVFTNKSSTVSISSLNTSVTTFNQSTTTFTASTNVTCTKSSTQKSSANSYSFAFASGFTTGKAGYATPNLSVANGKRVVSFWARSSIDMAANTFRIDFCSDGTGSTPTTSLTLDKALKANQWQAVTLVASSTIGSVSSMALTCLLDPGTGTLLLDNFAFSGGASDTVGFTQNHLIGKNNGEWYAIRSIETNAVRLDTGGANSADGSGRGYSGVSETVAVYAKPPISITSTPTLVTSNVQVYGGATGSSGSHVTISGGWDTTAMTSQTGDTVIDLLNGFGVAWDAGATNKLYIDWSKLGVVRGANLTKTAATNNTWTNCFAVNTSSTPFGYTVPTGTEMTNITCTGCAGFVTGFSSAILKYTGIKLLSMTTTSGFSPTSSTISGLHVVQDIVVNNSASTTSALDVSTVTCPVVNVTCNDNTSGTGLVPAVSTYNVSVSGNSIGIAPAYDCTIFDLTSASNSTEGINVTTPVRMVVYGGDISDTTATAITTPMGSVVLHEEGDTYGLNTTYSYFGTINMQTSVVPTSMTYAWKYSPTNAASIDAGSALGKREMPVARVACLANVDNTFTFACRRTSTNLTCNLRVYGGRYPGVGSAGTDITTSVNPSANTWGDYSITVHPTENCVVEIFFECYHDGTTTYSAYIGGPVVPS